MRRTVETIDSEVHFEGPDADGDYTLTLGGASTALTEADVRTLQFAMSNVLSTSKLLATKRARRSA